ncbi:unnamed protein product [Cyprideis torosa]|uniref:Uncharacterized protein n=1 Tax=Cyprideis torosa TaxID=163714 RepID=A0A7R8WAB6_9CRUS|nr:unnamed protein product [Cyprideis torosa]CAG0889473.1 unnamed protein product [Cyprideis torosa]
MPMSTEYDVVVGASCGPPKRSRYSYAEQPSRFSRSLKFATVPPSREEVCRSVVSAQEVSNQSAQYFIVDRSSLISLLDVCTKCNGPLADVRSRTVGSVLVVIGECPNCGPHQWTSSPRTKDFYKLDLDLTTSTALTGMDPNALKRTGKCMGLALPHKSTFSTIQEISHQFDAWYIQRRLGKVLEKAEFGGGQNEAQPWAQYLTNHLLWAIRNCEGSYKKFFHSWSSCLRHLVNDHQDCSHEELPGEKVKDTTWIEEGNPVLASLSEVVQEIDLKRATDLSVSLELDAFHSDLSFDL